MSSIRILPDQVANRIAAGEVVERPVAVVKELVENGIDARASRIVVTIQKGGKSLVRVEDNGTGMSPDDAMLCIERHATSKIQSSADLFNIRTLGFRGEALPSIASVSRFLLQTRTEGFLEGTEVLINGGKLIHSRSVGMPVGTRIEVTHLFSSIPARRKFLKTDNTEASHIVQTLRMLAVAHPSVGFKLISHDKVLFSVPENQEPLDRIRALWGDAVTGELIAFSVKGVSLSGQGYIGGPGTSRPSRHDIVTIINGRPVESRTIGFALTEACHTHIPKGRYPLVFLFLEVDPATIDVNIHPSKKEIKFKDEGSVRQTLIQTIWEVFKNHPNDKLPQLPTAPLSPAPRDPLASPYEKVWPPPVHSPAFSRHERTGHSHPESGWSPEQVRPSSTPPPTAQSLPDAPASPKSPTSTPLPSSSSGNRPFEAPGLISAPECSPAKSDAEWRFIGHFDRVFSLFERSSGLSLLHAPNAFRRIRFEETLSGMEAGDFARQPLILPVTLEVDLVQERQLKNLLNILNQCGITVSEFGRRFYRIEAIPPWIEPEQSRDLIFDMLAWSANESLSASDLSRKFIREVAFWCSMRSGSLAEYPLHREEAHHLLENLMVCRDPLSSPDGKPTLIHLPHRYFANQVNP